MRSFQILCATAVLLLRIAPANADYDLTPQRILATADVVPPMGLVGGLSVNVRGIDARGRVLLAAGLSDGTEILLRTDGGEAARALC